MQFHNVSSAFLQEINSGYVARAAKAQTPDVNVTPHTQKAVEVSLTNKNYDVSKMTPREFFAMMDSLVEAGKLSTNDSLLMGGRILVAMTTPTSLGPSTFGYLEEGKADDFLEFFKWKLEEAQKVSELDINIPELTRAVAILRAIKNHEELPMTATPT